MVSFLHGIRKSCVEWVSGNGRHVLVLDLLFLTALAALVILPGLGQIQNCVSHEVLHAETIREMADSGDYVETKILGKRIPDKPPVMHAQAALLTHWVGHPSMFLVRFPSAFAGLLGILATYGIGRILLDRKAALIGALILLSIPGYSLLARQALPDMTLCSWSLISCLGLALCMRSDKSSHRILYMALAGFASGISVLTKGPIGLFILALFVTLVPFGRTELKRPRLGWLVFGAALLLAAGIWAIPAYLRDNGVYLNQVVFQPDLNLGTKVKYKPFYLMLGYALLQSLPFSIFLPMTIWDWRKHGYSSLLAIAAAILLIFICIPKKRDHYLLPMYPFLSLAIAASIVRHKDTPIVSRTVRILFPVSLVSYPLFFSVIQPLVLPKEDPEFKFARETLPVIGQNSQLFCVGVHHEFLAWVGRRHEGIFRVKLDTPADIDQLRRAPKGSYLLIDSNFIDETLDATGPLPRSEVLRRPVKNKTWILYRLGEGS